MFFVKCWGLFKNLRSRKWSLLSCVWTELYIAIAACVAEELEFSYSRSSGPGGQHVNKGEVSEKQLIHYAYTSIKIYVHFLGQILVWIW